MSALDNAMHKKEKLIFIQDAPLMTERQLDDQWLTACLRVSPLRPVDKDEFGVASTIFRTSGSELRQILYSRLYRVCLKGPVPNSSNQTSLGRLIPWSQPQHCLSSSLGDTALPQSHPQGCGLVLNSPVPASGLEQEPSTRM